MCAQCPHFVRHSNLQIPDANTFSHFFSRFPAHRVIMAASSEYFKALLGPNFREGSEKLVTLKEIDGPTLKCVIDFIYTGNVTITNENVHAIIAAASSMGPITLETKCAAFWESILAVGNCVEILLNAEKYHLKELVPKAECFICVNFVAVPIGDIPKLSAVHMEKLLDNTKIDADESDIFDRLVHWIMEKSDEPKEVHMNLIKLIELERMPVKVSVFENLLDTYILSVALFQHESSTISLNMNSVAVFNRESRAILQTVGFYGLGIG